MKPVLEVSHLIKRYGQSPICAVNDISFSLGEGEILGFLGPNGSGKTTTIQILLGILSPTKGSIHYFGKDFFKNQSESLHYVTFASTYTSLPPDLTLEENLYVFGKLYGLSRAEINKESIPLLEQMGLLPLRKKAAGALSSGQITRLMLVKSLLTNPRIILLDEPTASLDIDASGELCNLLLERRKKTGLSILFTSHKLQEVSELCDRVIFLKKGEIIANETPSALARKSGSFKVRIIVPDHLEKLITYLKNHGYLFAVDEHAVEISAEESQIPILLSSLTKMEISYVNIQIKEPSLDDYFLQMAKL